MTATDMIPAAALSIFVCGSLAGAQLLPSGHARFLVRVPVQARAAALAAAATAASLVAIPAPGYAVLDGDAARIRNRLGLTVLWQGAAPCETRR